MEIKVWDKVLTSQKFSTILTTVGEPLHVELNIPKHFAASAVISRFEYFIFAKTKLKI